AGAGGAPASYYLGQLEQLGRELRALEPRGSQIHDDAGTIAPQADTPRQPHLHVAHDAGERRHARGARQLHELPDVDATYRRNVEERRSVARERRTELF